MALPSGAIRMMRKSASYVWVRFIVTFSRPKTVSMVEGFSPPTSKGNTPGLPSSGIVPPEPVKVWAVRLSEKIIKKLKRRKVG
jgi:hypothetical protein